MAHSKKRRKIWTDQEKGELIAGYEAQPVNKRIAYLRQHGANGGWFYRMRKAYLAQHGQPPAVPVVTLQSPALRESVPASVRNRGNVSKFAILPDDEKRRLILEYQALQPAGRTLWRQSHGDPDKPMTEAMVAYWKARLIGKKRNYKKSRKGPKSGSHFQRPDPDTEVRWVEEYNQLTHSGLKKSKWLKAHGMNHQHIWEMRRRVQMYKAKVKGEPGGSATAFDVALATIPTVIESHPPAPPTPMQEALHALRMKRAMEEGLMALKQRRTQMDESIGDLERALREMRQAS